MCLFGLFAGFIACLRAHLFGWLNVRLLGCLFVGWVVCVLVCLFVRVCLLVCFVCVCCACFYGLVLV